MVLVRQALDGRVTPELHTTMAGDWGDPRSTFLPGIDPVAPLARERRALLSRALPGATIVVPTGAAKTRSNDMDYPFRAHSDFAWLVGDLEPGRVLVMSPNGSGHDAVVYVRERGADMATVFTNILDSELNYGPRRGPAEVAHGFGVATAPLSSLDLNGLTNVHAIIGIDPLVDAALPEARGDELAAVLAGLRHVKDDWEVAQLQAAIDATVTGFEECVRELPAALGERGERWLEGTFWRRARRDGNEVGYTSIVACGQHATIGHWMKADGPVTPGELLLLDMGVENDRLYTADVTRTLPVSGRFTDLQREVYDVVWRSQQAGMAEVRPGATFGDIYEAAMTVIAEALVGWGLISDPVEQIVADCTHRRWSLSRISHHLGLDVHDCAAARDDRSTHQLEPGMVITVEPGLYFHHNDLTVPEPMRGMGIRIEDDLLVTPDGHRVLSAALPSHPDDVEIWMARLLEGTAHVL